MIQWSLYIPVLNWCAGNNDGKVSAGVCPHLAGLFTFLSRCMIWVWRYSPEKATQNRILALLEVFKLHEGIANGINLD